MMIWLLTFLILLCIVLIMAVGLILAKKPIVGSCGGLNKLGLKKDCFICGRRAKVEKNINTPKNEALFYDATKTTK